MAGEQDVEIEMEQSDPSGDFETRKLQGDGRVSIPERFYDYLGIEEGDSIIVACKESGVQIMSQSLDNLEKLREDRS